MKKELVFEPAGPNELSLYCYMGEAMCMIQELEAALSHSITLKKHYASSKEIADKALKKQHADYTLGQAIQLAEKRNLYAAELQNKLNDLNKKRNWLIHNSLLERRDDIYSPLKREELFKEIKSIAYIARTLQHEIELDIVKFCESKGKDMSNVITAIERRYNKTTIFLF